MNVIGHAIINGKPYINGKPAVWDDTPPLLDCFSHWKCPECNAALSVKGLICLNVCHLSAPAFRRFQAGFIQEK